MARSFTNDQIRAIALARATWKRPVELSDRVELRIPEGHVPRHLLPYLGRLANYAFWTGNRTEDYERLNPSSGVMKAWVQGTEEGGHPFYRK